MASWRTTLLGIIAGLMLLLPQIGAVIDDNPETNPEYTQIMAALAAMGLGVQARDNGVSSEQAKANKNRY